MPLAGKLHQHMKDKKSDAEFTENDETVPEVDVLVTQADINYDVHSAQIIFGISFIFKLHINI